MQTMVEYIERGKAIAEIDKGDLLVGDNAKWAKEILCRTPTADVVPVVRCKDCKHCEHFYPECDKDGNLREAYYCKSIKGDVKPDDYCCWGERRCD